MDRRDFLATCAASGVVLGHPFQCLAKPALTSDKGSPLEIFPEVPLVKHVQVAPLQGVSLAERHLYTCFQGLINRTEPRIYYVGDENDELWLDYYGEQYGVGHDQVKNADQLLERFSSELEGYVLYDPNLPDTRNVAVLLGGLKNALPVHPDLVPKLEKVGLKKIDDLTGRWNDRYEAYSWVLEELLPQANRNLLGTNCVDEPHWPTNSVWVDDYFIAHNIFVSDLSANRRDRADRELLDKIYAEIKKPGCLIGWRSARNIEHEMVGFAARRGIYVLCALSTLNMTVHTAIPRATEPFVQDHLDEEEVGPVEKGKIYVSFMNTDGDSLYSMLGLQSGRFKDPEHGQIPYTWAFFPLAYDLIPGVARYNYEQKKANDYFAASTCGVAYTYPYLLPNSREYLRTTRYYMEKTGLRTAYMSNWDDDWWWQDMETPGFHEALCEELPDAFGFVRGMGESAFEPHLFGCQAPYIFCGEGIHSDSDVYTTLRDFIEANSNRPLFVYCLVNHNTKLGEIMGATSRLPKDTIEYVRLDAFFHLLKQARQHGLVGDELYPDKTGVKKILAKEARAAWPGKYASILEHGKRAKMDEETFITEVKDPMVRTILDRTRTKANDVICFDAIWDSMHLARLALNIQGIYANNKKKGAEDFMRTFGDVEEAAVVRELWEKWERWEEEPVPYEEGAEMARRLAQLARNVNSELNFGGEEQAEDK